MTNKKYSNTNYYRKLLSNPSIQHNPKEYIPLPNLEGNLKTRQSRSINNGLSFVCSKCGRYYAIKNMSEINNTCIYCKESSDGRN
jgi:hypothetical protein